MCGFFSGIMCDAEELPPPTKQSSLEDRLHFEDPIKVSQGTQAGRSARPPLLRHHTSDMFLTPRRQPNGILRIQHQQSIPSPAAYMPAIPFYTSRSGHPYDTLYGTAYTNRLRRRPLHQYTFQDSPTSSIDCIPLKNDWNTDTANHIKVNGTAGSGASSHSCRCSCHCSGRNDGGGPEPEKPSDTLTWRRLHMSRAKLKATATTSELLSGFAMIAMVELQINEPTNVPEWLFVMFAVCTTVLVAVHIFALMISTYLLPNIDAASKMTVGDVLRDSPHERMRGFIELAWAFSTVLGLFLFLVEIAILCWVKFWDYSFAAATAATVIVIPVLIVFVAFAIHFYHSLVVHKYESSNEDIEQLESMKRNLDSATNTVNSPV